MKRWVRALKRRISIVFGTGSYNHIRTLKAMVLKSETYEQWSLGASEIDRLEGKCLAFACIIAAP